MQVRMYTPSYDFGQIEVWAKKRGLACPSFAEFPKIGGVVDNVAAGFLYVDQSSTVAFMENFITNPEAKPVESHEAINKIIDLLAYEAKLLGITTIRSGTSKSGVLKVAKKKGFVEAETNASILIMGVEQ